jgi:hypothetical protein
MAQSEVGLASLWAHAKQLEFKHRFELAEFCGK